MTTHLKPLALAAACALLLSACETTSAGYRPPPLGASDQIIEPGRFRVAFRGASRVSPAEVRDRALLHAAEVTLGAGFDWFEVVERGGDLAPPTTPRFSIGVGGGNFGRGGGFGLGGATSFGGEPTAVATLEIVAGKGAKPAGPDAYDARAIVETLRPRLS